jgi:hypothetical protein
MSTNPVSRKKPANASKGRQTPVFRYVLTISAIFVLIMSVGIFFTSRPQTPVLSGDPTPVASIAPDTAVGRGKITLESNRGKLCREFNNKTGRLTEILCDQTTDFAPDGTPAPRGTMKRLEAISKSFSGP